MNIHDDCTRYKCVRPAPGFHRTRRGGSKPPAAAQPLNIHRTARLRGFREAKSLPYQAWAYELPIIIYKLFTHAIVVQRHEKDLLFAGRYCIIQARKKQNPYEKEFNTWKF